MIETIECFSWGDFKQRLKDSVYNGERIARGKYLFRGQGDANWELSSSFDRAYSEVEVDKRNQIEKLLIDNFKKECEADENYRTILSDDISTIALAQHFGVPTRLLDWTESPYIAAFFAFQGHFYSTVFQESIGTSVAIWILYKDSYIWSESTGVQLISPESWNNERLRTQYGWFTLSKTPFPNLEEYANHFEDADIALRKIVLPADLAGEAIPDLDLMGINHGTLFPDLEGRARAAIVKTLLYFEENT